MPILPSRSGAAHTPFPPRSRGRIVLWLLVASLAVTTCTDDTGPGRAVPGYVALAPRYVADAAGIVPVVSGRFVLTRQPGGEVALDTVVPISAGADSVDLSLTVQVLTPGERFLLRILLVGPAPANDTVFRAGPLEVIPTTSGQPPPIDVPLVYVGVGANAASVVITQPDENLVAGTPTTLTAEAFDGAGQPIPGTPVGWRSLDTVVARVPDEAVGAVLGAARGSARIVASLLTGPADTVTVNVTLPPAALVADSGSGQTGPAAGLLPASLVARVTASDGVAVPGVLVRFAVTVGGGSVSADSVLTDGTGRARTDWTLGNVVGAQTVTATTGALSASFTATSQATGAGAVTITAGDNQSALVGTAVGTAPQVRVTDAQSNPVPNVEVVFAVAQGGGSVTAALDTTDTSGFAAVGSWILGPAIGMNALTATVSGLTPVQFLAYGTSTGGVTSMTLNAGGGQTALAGTAVPIAPSVLLTDTAGAPIAGVAVTFAVTAGSGTLADTTPVSDASGIASVGTWTLGTAGTNVLTASMPGLPNVTFSATATVGAPAQIVIVSGDGQSDTTGTTLAAPLVVEVQDSAANPVPNISVAWNTFDGSITPPTGTTDGTGRTQASWTLSTNKVTQTATATVTNLTPAVFTATAIFPDPSILITLAGGDRVRVGSTDTLDVTLTAPAPVNGVFVSVVSSNAAVLLVDTITGGVLIPEGNTTGEVLVEGVGGGTVTLTASAAGYSDGVLSVPVSQQVLGMPTTLNVPFGNTASLPLQISTPAPAGGATVTLVSTNPSAVAVLTPTVTIPEGQQTANATLSGVFPGSATVTGSTADYGTAQTLVSTTASINVVQATQVINASFGDSVDIELRSGGVLIAAPAPGVVITVTPRDPTCVAATSPVTIPTGLVNVRSVITYGGSAAQFPCTSWVVASAPNIDADSVSVTVNAPPVITLSPVTVGGGLQRSWSASLGFANRFHGGVNVTIQSSNPAVALVAPDATTEGTASIVVALLDGQYTIPFYVQGVEGATDTARFTVSSPLFVDGSAVMTIVQPGIDMSGPSASTTSLSADNPFTIRTGVPNGTGTGMTDYQPIRAGGTAVTVTVTSSQPTVGQLVTTALTGGTVTAQIVVGQQSTPSSVAAGGVALDPQGPGTTDVAASVPGFITTTSTIPRTVTVTAPAITVNPVTVGGGLQLSWSASLGFANRFHGGVNVTIQSSNPAVARVAPDATTEGTASIVVALLDGQYTIPFYVQGVEGQTGAVTFTVSSPLFVDGSAVMTIVQPGIDLSGLITTTTVGASDDPFTIRTGVPNGTGTGMASYQAIRAGGAAVTVTLVSSSAAVGQLVTTAGPGGTVTVQIVVGASSTPSSVALGGVAFDPLTEGTTDVAASVPGFIATTSTIPLTVAVNP